MELITVILYLFIPTALGYSVVNLISLKNSPPRYVKLMLGYGIGTGLLTNWVILLCFLKIPLNAISINFPILLTTLFLMYTFFKLKNKVYLLFPKVEEKLDLLSWLFCFFILYILYFIFWSGVNIPISEWDTYSTLGLKAKTIYYNQSLNYLSFIGKFDYPVHLEILLAWLSFCLGYWDNTLIKIFYPMSCLAYIVIQYHFLRSFTSMRWALFSIVLLLSSAFLVYHSLISYRDVTMMFYNCTSILLIILWYKEKQIMYLLLGALFSGFTSFVKLEGLGYLAIHNLLVCLLMSQANHLDLKEKVKYTALFGMIGFSIYLLFMFYKNLYILPFVPLEMVNPEHFNLSQLNLNLSSDTLFRIKIVLRRYVSNLFLSGNWSLVWLIFLISLIHISKKIISIEIKALFFVLGSFFSIYLFSYIFTQHYIWVAFKEDVMSRSILHIFPIVTILIPLLNTAEEAN